MNEWGRWWGKCILLVFHFPSRMVFRGGDCADCGKLLKRKYPENLLQTTDTVAMVPLRKGVHTVRALAAILEVRP